MIAYHRLRITSATSRRVRELLQSPKFNIEKLCYSGIIRQGVSHLANRTVNTLGNSPKDIDEQWAAVKNAPFAGIPQSSGHVPKGRQKI